MSQPGYVRIAWLARRLSRIGPAELPYRVLGVVRTAAQRRGWFDAARPPARLDGWPPGAPWVRMPADPAAPAVIAAAENLLQHGVPVFDALVPLNHGSPAWNRCPGSGHEFAATFGLGIDFRHLGDGVDIKYTWELNRHCWWVTLAQAWRVSGQQRYLDLLGRLLTSWLDACPYPLGPNWSSPVEHGIRLVNWSIVWHLLGGAGSPLFAGAAGEHLRQRWTDAVYQHICFASDNYSLYSSSDNHLIGEAAGVFVGAHTWDLWQAARPLRARAKRILEREIARQFSSDGVNLEQALCYHRFSLEFLLAAALAGHAAADAFSAGFARRMEQAIVFLAAMTDCAGRVPHIGDADDGVVFAFAGSGAASPYQAMLGHGARLSGSAALRAKLDALGAAALYRDGWLAMPAPPPAAAAPTAAKPALPCAFPRGGYLILGHRLHRPDELRVTFDVGPLGLNRIAGHGHADCLAILLGSRGEEFLVDPGTYCYNAAPRLRRYFRGTQAHNTACIDGLDQSAYGGSFLWLRDVTATLHAHGDRHGGDGEGGGGRGGADTAWAEASHDGYLRLADPLRHVRSITLDRPRRELLVRDRFECARPHRCSLHWHFAPECALRRDGAGFCATRRAGQLHIALDAPGLAARIVAGDEGAPLGWVSRRFYRREPAGTLALEGVIAPNAVITTRFTYSPLPHAAAG